MTTAQLSFADERRARRNADRMAERYAASLEMLDMRHAVEALAAEEAARLRAPSCRCRGGWTDDGATCGKCGWRLP